MTDHGTPDAAEQPAPPPAADTPDAAEQPAPPPVAGTPDAAEQPAPPPAADTDAATERALAVALYNRTWELLAIPDRTPAQADETIHTAHASRYHWGRVGEPVNLARGEWLCSRVYAVLGRGEPALWHARRCVAIEEAAGIADWDIAAAYEAMARASAVAGDMTDAREWAVRCRDACRQIAEDDDRELIEADLAAIPFG